jgi:hypothetical protein
MLLLFYFHLGAINNFYNYLWKKNITINYLFFRELLCLVDELSNICVSQLLYISHNVVRNSTLQIKECSWLVLNILHIIIVVIS